MGDEQYDLPQRVLRAFKEKSKLREALKYDYMKLLTSPYRREPMPLDPAIVRYHALMHYRPEQMRITAKNFYGFFSVVLLPIGITYYFVQTTIEEREKELRSGKVAYKDRFMKHII